MCDLRPHWEQTSMRIGSSIGLIAVGLILALAVNIPIKGLDLHQIGWILVFVGVVGLVVCPGDDQHRRSGSVRR